MPSEHLDDPSVPFSEITSIQPPAGLREPFFNSLEELDSHAQMQGVAESLQALKNEEVERERRMVSALEGMRAQLVAAGKREVVALNRARDAEQHNALMVKLTAASVAFAALATVLSGISLFS